MTKQERELKHLIKRGESVTLKSVTGTACPCWTFRGTGYSPQWHVDNSEADACNGTGLIDTTTTTINLKATLYPVEIALSGTAWPDTLKTAIGEIGDIDLVMYGSVNSDTDAFVSLQSYTQQDDYVIYNSINYIIAKVIPLTFYEYILLKRKST